MRRHRIAAFIATGVLALAACTQQGVAPNTNGDSTLLQMADGTTIFRHDAIGGMDALANGELARIGTCVGMLDADGLPMIVIWPRGTEELTGDRDGITVGYTRVEIIFGEKFVIGDGNDPNYGNVVEECGAPEGTTVWITNTN